MDDHVDGDFGTMAEGRFLMHFVLKDDSHDMNALVLHDCEGDVFALLKEIGKQLDVEFQIEAAAYGEGGIEVYLKFIGTHAVALALIGGTITAICGAGTWMRYQSVLLQQQIQANDLSLNRDKKLADQQIEKNELDLKKARIELRKLEQETSPDAQRAPATSASKSLPLEPPPKPEDVVPALLANRRVIKFRSQFYERLLTYDKVSAVGFAPTHNPTSSEELVVPRSQFGGYVITQRELESTLVPNAEVEIVAPVLKRGTFKWRGLFENRSISFEVGDEAFLSKVMKKKVKFQSGTTLVCDLEIHWREDGAGDVEPHAHVVRHVSRYYAKPTSSVMRNDEEERIYEPHEELLREVPMTESPAKGRRISALGPHQAMLELRELEQLNIIKPKPAQGDNGAGELQEGESQ